MDLGWLNVTQNWSTYVLTLSVLQWYIGLLKSNEFRSYLVELPDPSFKYLPLYDTSVPLFVVQWSSVLNFLYHWSDWDPGQFCWTYVCFMVFRTLVLWMHPFRAHHTRQPLRDILLQLIVGESRPLDHDLSFSGHTSLLVIFGLLLESQRVFFGLATVLTIVLLILSRVHYLADCLLAPPVVYSVHVAAVTLYQWHSHGLSLLLAAVFWHLPRTM